MPRLSKTHTGDTLGFQVRIDNPGPPIAVELKTGARLPNGSIVPIQDLDGQLPTGVSVVPVFVGFVLPAGVPPGTYTLLAWHETLKTQTQTVTVAAGEVKELQFVWPASH